MNIRFNVMALFALNMALCSGLLAESERLGMEGIEIPSPYRCLVLNHTPSSIIVDSFWPYEMAYSIISSSPALPSFVVTVEGLPGPRYLVRVYDTNVSESVEGVPAHQRKKYVRSEREIGGEAMKILNDYVFLRILNARWGYEVLETGSNESIQYISFNRSGIGTVRAYTINSTGNADALELIKLGSYLRDFSSSKISETDLSLFVDGLVN